MGLEQTSDPVPEKEAEYHSKEKLGEGCLEIKCWKTKDSLKRLREREAQRNRAERSIRAAVWLLLRELRNRKSIAAATQTAT